MVIDDDILRVGIVVGRTENPETWTVTIATMKRTNLAIVVDGTGLGEIRLFLVQP